MTPEMQQPLVTFCGTARFAAGAIHPVLEGGYPGLRTCVTGEPTPESQDQYSQQKETHG